jgi:hypothetical protein
MAAMMQNMGPMMEAMGRGGGGNPLAAMVGGGRGGGGAPTRAVQS